MRRSDFGAERETESLVHGVDRRERVGHERTEVDVDDTVGRDRSVATGRDRTVEPDDEVLRELGRDLARHDVVAPEPAQRAQQRRERRDDPQRVAMRLHEQRVRVLVEQRAEAPQMAG